MFNGGKSRTESEFTDCEVSWGNTCSFSYSRSAILTILNSKRFQAWSTLFDATLPLILFAIKLN